MSWDSSHPPFSLTMNTVQGKRLQNAQGPPLPTTTASVRRVTPQRKQWVCLTWALTGCIPSFVLWKIGKMDRQDVRMAWREKVALNILIALMCALMLFFIIGLGRIICPNLRLMSQGEIDGYNKVNKPYVSAYGYYYRIDPIIKSHVNQLQFINKGAMEATVLGRDVSGMFYKTDQWKKYCGNINQPSGWDNYVRDIPKDVQNIWYPHQSKDGKTDYLQKMDYMRKGTVARDNQWISNYLAANTEKNRVIVAYGRVYDVSTYDSPTNTNNFLGEEFGNVIRRLGPTGKDATDFLENIRSKMSSQRFNGYLRCMDAMFFTGVMDTRNSIQCLVSNYIMLASTSILVAVIGFKFLAALQTISASKTPTEFKRNTIIQVTCYTEGVESLQKTINSISDSKFDDQHRLLLVICDGLIIGSGNTKSTPEIVLELLGVDLSKVMPETKMFQSLGEGRKQLNYAQIYSGFFDNHGRQVPYLVVVKVGAPTEDSKPGNRGKRDSQLLLLRFLNRVLLELPMSPMELEMYYQMKTVLNMDPKSFEYLLMVDADTEVQSDALNRMISHMVKDQKVIGLCGETLIQNDFETWVTMIQVYEYFISHHMAKAFESWFGTVTCLPGCFSMYRIQNSHVPIVASPGIIKDYSENYVDTLHKKNLLHLGEDRYLTTLMMKHFPDLRMCFQPDAKCKTNVPARWSVFVSQRRRWINSTVHNLAELLTLPQMCGFCCLSMRFVVFLDLFATVVQPAAVFYIGYLIWWFATDELASIPMVSLLMIAAVYGFQLVIIILQQEWQHIGWFFVYIVALPIYAFYLPIYSFWHFDDFTWGNTRVVMEEDVIKVINADDNDSFSVQDIPHMKWSEYQSQLIQQMKEMEENEPLETETHVTTIYPFPEPEPEQDDDQPLGKQ